MAEKDKDPKAPQALGTAPDGARPRRSVWESYAKVVQPRAPLLPAAQKDAKPRGPLVFYIVLTTWAGTRLALRCVAGRDLPMEAAPLGGTYIFFPSGLVYVQESAAAVNAKIYHRLRQMQDAWVAA
jgi:hypothetical protein